MRRLSEGRYVGVVCFLSSVLGVGRIGARNRKVSQCEIENIWILGNRGISRWLMQQRRQG